MFGARPLRLPLTTIAAAIAVAALPASASAHALLVRTIPADGSRVAASPLRVVVVFDDVVQVGPGNDVVRNGGASVLAGTPHASGDTLVLPLRAPLADGAYTARWSIVSDDGHNEAGVIAFTVGAGPPPTASLSADARPSTFVVLARWWWFCSLLAAGGLALVALLLLRTRAPGRPLATALVSTAAAGVALASRSDGGVGTRFGIVVFLSAAVAAIGAVLARFLPPAAAVPALALLAAPTLSGHALDASQSWTAIPIDLAHVVAAAVWLGALVAIVVLRVETARLAFAALASVVLLAATGVGRAIGELGSLSQVWSTSYGLSLVAKTVLFAAALVLAAVGRSRLRDTRPVAAELGVVVLLLLAVGVLTSLFPGSTSRVAAATPAREGARALAVLPAADAVVLGEQDGSYSAAIAVRPSGAARVTFVASDTKAVDVGPVTIDGTPTHGCGIGCYDGTAPTHGTVVVEHGGRRLRFDLGRPEPAAALFDAVDATYHRLRWVEYVQHIATGLGTAVTAHWQEAPEGFSYRLASGGRAIVIGRKRWDKRPGEPWKRSRSLPAPGIIPPWGSEGPFRNAHVLRRSRTSTTLSFLGASLRFPAWFTITVDPKTLAVRTIHMTATAHFMRARYLRWNRPFRLTPPG